MPVIKTLIFSFPFCRNYDRRHFICNETIQKVINRNLFYKPFFVFFVIELRVNYGIRINQIPVRRNLDERAFTMTLVRILREVLKNTAPVSNTNTYIDIYSKWTIKTVSRHRHTLD